MQYTELGRTGLRVSVVGLGCGGFSRLGQTYGHTEAQSIDVVRAAMDRGVNFLDTAENYRTEEIVGKAVGAERERVVISTKTSIARDGELRSADAVVASLDASLGRLNTDHVDVFHMHGVLPAHVDYAINEIVPALLQQQAAGKVKHLGITETAPSDVEHKTLTKALDSDLFDVVMVAFHLLHQNARSHIFPVAQRNRVATLLMFAVRLIFSQPERLVSTLRTLHDKGQISDELLVDGAFSRLIAGSDDPAAVMNVAYRYARHEPGVDVLLLGTGNIAHLQTNINSVLAPALAEDTLAKIRAEFAHLVGVGLDKPT